jgi:hypothetical protein
MLEKTLFHESFFWDFMSYIQKHNVKRVTLEELKLRLGLTEEQLIKIVSFCHKFEYPIRIDRDILGRAYLVISSQTPKVTINMEFNEWLALQAHFHHTPQEVKEMSFFPTIEQKIQSISEHLQQYNLFQVIEKEREKQKLFTQVNDQNIEFIERLDQALLNELCLVVKLKGQNAIDFFPLKLVVIDGQLSAVGEDRSEGCLIYFETVELEDITLDVDENYQSTFTKVEVEDFISSLRNVMGTEERLVLKLRSQNAVDLNPPFQHLGKPFITSNMEGEIIWAASVERSEHLYAWLYDMRHEIQILDPVKVIEEFENYKLIRESEDLKAA